MTTSEKLALASRIQRVRYAEEQHRLVARANALTCHPPQSEAAAPPKETDLDSIKEAFDDTSQVDVDQLLASAGDCIPAHACAECGAALRVPERGGLPKYCGATCRKRAERRRNSG